MEHDMGSDDDADMISGDDLTFTQVGSSVIGTYAGTFALPRENDLGSVTGMVQGDALIGTWYESGAPETTGLMEFVMCQLTTIPLREDGPAHRIIQLTRVMTRIAGTAPEKNSLANSWFRPLFAYLWFNQMRNLLLY